ncbi:MAG TPA: pilus assembly protein N-terminal domain-containing protein [Terriglobales bacterium]|nr:pilus assembly protein N-terminal domain-containing protein [Terriglobales bacterium]
MAEATAPAGASAAAAPQASHPGEQGPESVHIVVGHSLLIRTQNRVKRILTGNPAVIESVVTSPEEVVVTAKTPGTSSLMLWDESGQNRSLDVYADLDVSSLRSSLDETFPSSNVDIQSEADRVMLVGTVGSKDVADQMLKMASNFSKEVVDGLRIAAPPRQKQVMLKIRFAEADRSKLSQFGFNLFSTGATNTIGTISTNQYNTMALQQGQNGTAIVPPSTPQQFLFQSLGNIFLFRPDINLGANLQALQEKNVLQILAEPNLMALSGEPAHFLAGGEFPYPVVQGGAAGTVPTVTIMFQPYGVKLEFVATIEDNNTIRLKVAPEVSSLDYSNTVTLSGFVLPAISTRRAQTEIELKDGQSFGIAGLLDHRTTVQLSKIPGIGDIPILGELFKSRNATLSNTELIVFVTPEIVDPVGGQVPATEPTVTMPMQSGVDNNSFDKNLPYAPPPGLNPIAAPTQPPASTSAPDTQPAPTPKNPGAAK